MYYSVIRGLLRNQAQESGQAVLSYPRGMPLISGAGLALVGVG